MKVGDIFMAIDLTNDIWPLIIKHIYLKRDDVVSISIYGIKYDGKHHSFWMSTIREQDLDSHIKYNNNSIEESIMDWIEENIWK